MANDLTLAQFKQLLDDSRTECDICGWRGHSLGPHFAESHADLNLAEHKKKNKKLRLASRLTVELLRLLPRDAHRSQDWGDALTEQFSFPSTDGGIPAALKTLRDGDTIQAPEGFPLMVPAVDEHFVFGEVDVRKIAYAYTTGAHTYDSGPTGCGKTAKYLQFFGHLGMPVQRVNFNGDVTYQNFVGTRNAVDGNTSFQHGFLPKAMLGDGTRGYPIILDEIDYAPPHIAAVLNPVLDEGVLYIPDTGETIKALPGFSAHATANTGGRGDRHGNYHGTELLNIAFLDRFGVKLTSDYLTPAVERAMLTARYPQESGETIEALVKAAGLMRVAFIGGQINITFSTRKLIDYFAIKAALGEEDAIHATVLDWTDEDDGATVKEFLTRCSVPGVTV